MNARMSYPPAHRKERDERGTEQRLKTHEQYLTVVDRATCLNPEDVQGAIKSDIGNGGNLQSGSNTRYIEVDGKTLRYNAYKLPDGTINVGKIVVER